MVLVVLGSCRDDCGMTMILMVEITEFKRPHINTADIDDESDSDGEIAEFRGPHVNGDEAESGVVDGLSVFPVHLAQNTGWSVLHHHIFFFHFKIFVSPSQTNVKSSEGVSSAPLPPPDSLFGPPPPLETTTGGSPGPQDPTNILAPVSSCSTVSYVNHPHYYPTELYSGYPVASVFSAAGAQKAALQPTRQRTKARSNAGKK